MVPLHSTTCPAKNKTSYSYADGKINKLWLLEEGDEKWPSP